MITTERLTVRTPAHSATRTLRVIVVASLALLGARTADAQICVGQPANAIMARNVSSSIAGGDLRRTLLARYGVAGERLFAGAAAGYIGREFADPQSFAGGGDVGLTIPLGQSGATVLCPFASTLFQSSRGNLSLGNSRLQSSLGLSVGRSIRVSSSFTVVPFLLGGVQYARARYTGPLIAFGFNNPPGTIVRGASSSVTTEAGFGFGLRVGDRFTVTPSYRVPLNYSWRAGMEQMTYSLSMSFGIPR